jgi:hypothetical protein
MAATRCPYCSFTLGRRYGNPRAEEIGRLVLSRPPGRDDRASAFPHWTCADKPDMDSDPRAWLEIQRLSTRGLMGSVQWLSRDGLELDR